MITTRANNNIPHKLFDVSVSQKGIVAADSSFIMVKKLTVHKTVFISHYFLLHLHDGKFMLLTFASVQW